MMSSLIQYNSQFRNVVSWITKRYSLTNYEKGAKLLEYSGKPAIVSDFDVAHEGIAVNGGYSPIALKYFHKIVSFCKERNINLIICISPSLVLMEKERDYLKNLCTIENVTCWDFSNDVTDKLMFSDASHLNEKGAILFTKVFIEKLNKQQK